MDPSHSMTVSQRRSSDPETLRRAKLKQLKRQLSNVRRKMEALEIDFENSNGYKPSQVGCWVSINI